MRLIVFKHSADLTSRALVILAALTQEFDADFYIKVDDDVALNVNALSFYLSQRRGQGNHYMVRWAYIPTCEDLCNR